MAKAIFITGVKHSGKSTLGKLASDKLNLSFFDIDKIIEDNNSLSCREIFRNFGRERFQKEEKKALDQLLEKEKNFVCATGGGICDNSAAFQLLKKGFIIYIGQKWNILFERISRGGIPPFLKSDNPKEEFKELFLRRDRLYRESADLIIESGKRTPIEVFEELNMKLKEKNHVR